MTTSITKSEAPAVGYMIPEFSHNENKKNQPTNAEKMIE